MRYHGKWRYQRESWWAFWKKKVWILEFIPPLIIPGQSHADIVCPFPPPMGPKEFDCEINIAPTIDASLN